MYHLILITSVRYANVGTDYLTVCVPLLPYCLRHCYLTVCVPLLPYCLLLPFAAAVCCCCRCARAAPLFKKLIEKEPSFFKKIEKRIGFLKNPKIKNQKSRYSI
ncbi:hypothetical protein MmiAt1_05050 [Methanimicrococcus sp. At1]|uniref:Uncharacterized protein n=1 Tax=Methanimicrococcus hacksteinii TaxID=3028293 RepID=A0ABU3VPZ4_9EURY|nr:hypothetical protein [Methanimicrococcus sp. At1]